MHDLVNELLVSRILSQEDWSRMPSEFRDALDGEGNIPQLLRSLVEHQLLTPYQAGRVEAGTTTGLVFGAYRVLDRLGIGDQGVILRGEHIHLRTPVVLKLLGPNEGNDWSHLPHLARVRHPGLIPFLDAGELHDGDGGSSIRYLVREHVRAVDLETHVHGRGVLTPMQTCDILQQVAITLSELHSYGLVHGRLKPANVLLAADNRVHLIDSDIAQSRVAGAARRVHLDWMAPEQLIPGQRIDEKTDLYCLGCLLFWCLIGESLYNGCRTTAEALSARRQEVPAMSGIDPGIPVALDQLLTQLLAFDPADRPAGAREVADFLYSLHGVPASGPRIDWQPQPRVLLAANRVETLTVAGAVLSLENVLCEEACEWTQALRLLETQSFDLIMLGCRMEGLPGPEMCASVRSVAVAADVPLLVLLEQDSPDDVETLLRAGADDVALLPQSVVHLQRRVRVLIRLKAAQDRAGKFQRALAQVDPRASTDETGASLDALLLLVSRIAQERQGSATWRGPRIQRYVRLFAEEIGRHPGHPLTQAYLDLLIRVTPLVDLGFLLVSDEVLLTDDPALMRHDLIARNQTVEAARLLRSVAAHHRPAWGTLQMAIEVVRHHQERFDGLGYPDRLQGSDIPLSARLVAPCVAYDNLHSPRPYRPALTHRAALEMLQQTWHGAFDPALREAFFRAASSFTQ